MVVLDLLPTEFVTLLSTCRRIAARARNPYHVESAAPRNLLSHSEAALPSADDGHIHGFEIVMFLAFVRRVKQVRSGGSTAPRYRQTDRVGSASPPLEEGWRCHDRAEFVLRVVVTRIPLEARSFLATPSNEHEHGQEKEESDDSGFIKHEDTETQGTEKKRINGL